MKSTGVFLAALFGLTFLVSAGMLVTATMKPEWFGMKTAQSDTLAAHAGTDSTKHAAPGHALPGEHADTIKTESAEPQHVAQAGEAASGHGAAGHAATAEAKEPPKAESGESAHSAQSVQAAQAREGDLQNLVKLYEAMKPEDAAKILSKMPDKEVRSIILLVKKKQAAKILSYFDASKAAMILAQ